MSELEAGGAGEPEAASPALAGARPCERCGSFAALRSNGFRAWCDACWARHAHPLDDPGHTVGELLTVLGAVLAEHWPLAFGLVLLRTLPVLVLPWVTTVPGWFNTAWVWSVGSFPEAIIVAAVVARSLGSRPALRPVLRTAVRRFPAALGTNVLAGIPVMAGVLLCCVPGLALGALLLAVIPLAVVEGLPPHRAFAESWRRSRPLFGPLFATSALLFAVSAVPALIEGGVAGFTTAQARPLDPTTQLLLSAGADLAGAMLSVPSLVFQVVAWAATRPERVRRPGSPAPAPASP